MRSFVMATALVGSLLLPTGLQAQPFSTEQQEEIGEIVREYLLQNPEIVVEVLTELERREQVAAQEAQAQAIAAASDRLYNDPTLPYAGATDGETVIIEFMDYQCGFCKRMLEPMHNLVANNEDLKVIFVDIPILGPASVMAARAALAAGQQNAYNEMHDALMGHEGTITEGLIFQAADALGLDADRLREDMDGDVVNSRIQANLELANLLGVRGTPAFVFEDALMPGAVGEARLQALIDGRG